MKSQAIFAAALAGLVFLAPLGAQDQGSVLLSYERNFARSSLSTKLEIVRESSAYKAADMGPLYGQALRFVVEAEPLLGADVELKNLALAAAAKAGEAAYREAAGDLLGIFDAFPDAELRAAAASALGAAGQGQPAVVARLNAFAESEAAKLAAGQDPESPTLSACLAALGSLGEASSRGPLFAVYSGLGGTGGPADQAASADRAASADQAALKKAAASALELIKGDYGAFLAQKIGEGSLPDKLASLELCLGSSALSAEAKGGLAEAALSAGLAAGVAASGDAKASSAADLALLDSLEGRAVDAIRDLKWQRAAPLVLQYYRLHLAAYGQSDGSKSPAERDPAERGRLLKAIGALGAMGSTEAVQALSLQLQLINGQTEQGGAFDEAVILSLVGALGELGDKTAFDYLLYIGYLQYPDSIKQAAKLALQKLRW